MGGGGRVDSHGWWEQMRSRLQFLASEIESELRNRDWRHPVQPWSQFFERFTWPNTELSAWRDRVVLNSRIYQTNYVIMLVVFLAYYSITHPWSILLLVFIATGCFFAQSPSAVVFQGKRISREQLRTLTAAASLLLLLLSGTLVSVLQHFALVTAVIFGHASFRHTGIRSKIKEFRDQMSNKW